jgi:ribosome maturation factor RimP
MTKRLPKKGLQAGGTSRKHKDMLSEKSLPEAPRKKPSVTAEDIRRIAEPLCEAEGIELVHAEYQREAGGRVLRLYIDKPGGVMLDDCVHISRQLGDLLDVSFENMEPYNLEVSSPGPDRPLGKKSDFERFQGNLVKIRTIRQIEGRKNFRGILSGTAGDRVSLLIDDKTVSIPFQEITRARLVPEKQSNG